MSLVKTAPGAAEYYIEYAVEGSERAGEWMGQGAKQLELSGSVDATILRNLFKGLYPDGSRPLVRLSAIRSDLEHAPAWDLCLSPPKDVSVIAALFDDLKDTVDECHRVAVRAAAEYVESEAAYVRRGSGGIRLEKAKLIIAAFEHHTSRNDDPQKHTHLLILNAAAHSEGFGTVVSKFFYDKQIAIQNVYLATLATELRTKLGVSIEAIEGGSLELGEAFKITGVPDPLRKYMSSRRGEILSARSQFGITTAHGMDRAAMATRREKTHRSPSVLRPIWKETAAAIGVNLADFKYAILNSSTVKQQPAEAEVQQITVQTPERPESRKPAPSNVHEFPVRSDPTDQKVIRPDPTTQQREPERLAAKPAEKSSARSQETPNRGDEKKAFLQSAVEKPADNQTASATPIPAVPEKIVTPAVAASMIESVTRSALAAKLPDPLVNRLIDHVLEEYDRKQRVSRIGAVAARREDAAKALPKLLKSVDILKTDDWYSVHRDRISSGVAGALTSRDADAALVTVLESTGAIACVNANAGVDTNRFIHAMAKHYEKAGFNPRLFTATSTAASELQTATGLQVNTVSQLLPRLKTEPLSAGLHHATQILREAVNLDTKKLWSFNGQTVVFVAQAQSLRTADLAKILAEAEAKIAKVVLIGSSDQLVRREPHCAYEEVAKRIGGAIKLPEPPVQRQEWMVDAAKQVSRGDVRGAYSQYVLANRLHLAPDQRAATIEMARHWASLSKKEQNGKTIMIADSARDARVLNKLAQESRRKSGLPRLLRQKLDGTWVRRGDRVLFRAGSKHYGIRAGELGTIERIGLNGMTVRLDRTRWALLARPPVRVQVPKSLYRGMSLGYALTTTDAQGLSFDKSLVLPKAGGNNVSGLSVQLASARDDTRIFTSVRSVGEDIEAIERSFRQQTNDATRKQQVQGRPASEELSKETLEKLKRERQKRHEEEVQQSHRLRP